MSIYINKDTKVITQGITGKTGQFHTLGCQAYANGKNAFVAGVTPRRRARSSPTSQSMLPSRKPLARPVPPCP